MPRAGRIGFKRCKGHQDASAVARFDVAMTVCTMRYVSDLRIGRINPQHFKYGLSVEGERSMTWRCSCTNKLSHLRKM